VLVSDHAAVTARYASRTVSAAVARTTFAAVVILGVGSCAADPAPPRNDALPLPPSPQPTVSPEEPFALPDFVGHQVESVEARAERLQLVLVKRETASRKKPGTVLSQKPAAGRTVESYTVVHLVVAVPRSQVEEDPQPPEDAGRKPGEAPSKFTGVHAENYEIAYDVCKVFGLREVAKEFKTPRNPVAAEGYASGYRPGFQQAPFEGCLDGLLANG